MPLRTGQPLAQPIELTLGASSLANTKPPAAAADQALEVPDHQIRGELRLRIFERGELAIIHERAVGHATKLDETQADVDSGQPWSAGVATRYAIHPGGAPWAVGLDFELLRWAVPYTEIRTCIENCGGVDPYQEIHSSSGEVTWGFGVTPSYRIGRVSLFGGAFVKNHPTILRKGTELTEANDDDLNGGPLNVLVHAGVAVQMGAVTALLLVNQNLDRDPVSYGPGIGFALSAAIPGISTGASADTEDKLAAARARMRRAQARRDAVR